MGIKSILRILLSLAIIAGFFLPWITLSAFDIVRFSSETTATTDSQTAGQVVWYASVLIPLFALICLIQSVSNKTPSGFVRAVPFLVCAILVALLFIGSTDNDGASASDFFTIVGIGLYLTLGASFLLMFLGRDTTYNRTVSTTNTTTL